MAPTFYPILTLMSSASFLIISLKNAPKHVFVCVYEYVFACMCLYGGQRLMLGIFLHGASAYYFLDSLSLNLEPAVSIEPACQ